MRESEAKTKVCPIMQITLNEPEVVYEKTQPLLGYSVCIGHECMAWKSLSEDTGCCKLMEPRQ